MRIKIKKNESVDLYSKTGIPVGAKVLVQNIGGSPADIYCHPTGAAPDSQIDRNKLYQNKSVIAEGQSLLASVHSSNTEIVVNESADSLKIVEL